jgi:PAS domain S-box-containing protein
MMASDIDLARAILASASDAIVATDREGVIRFWNAGAERIFGFSGSEAIGQSLDIIIPERLRARHWDGYLQVMRSGKSRYGQGELLSVPAMRKDARRISVEFSIVPLPDASGVMDGMVAIMRDVTKGFEEMRELRARLAAAAAAAAAITPAA